MEFSFHKPLTRVRLRGFKSIKECDLELRKINVLIGANGSGKSNFISVFRFLQTVLNSNLQYGCSVAGVNTIFYNGIKATHQIELEVYFGENAYGFCISHTDDLRVVFKDEYFCFSGSEERKFKLGTGHFETLFESGVKNGIDYYVLPVLRQRGWRVYHFHDTSRTANLKQEHNIDDSLALHSDAGNIAAFLYMLRESYRVYYDEIVRAVQLVAPFFDDFVLEAQPFNKERIALRWKKYGCEEIFYASQFSDGTLRFICLAVLFLQPSTLKPATIIVDEPEIGLHPAAITVLSEMIKVASLDSQVIISTQSIDLLNQFDVEDVVVVDSGNEGTTLKRLSADELQVWLDNDFSLGDIWSSNIIGGRP